LEDKIRHSWVDPRQFKSDSEYAYAEKVAWASANAAQEIIDYIENAPNEVKRMESKKKGEETLTRIGE